MSLITNQNSNETASHPNENGYDKKKVREDVEKKEHFILLVGIELVQPVWKAPQKTENRTII
jgi:hypothetical protein